MSPDIQSEGDALPGKCQLVFSGIYWICHTHKLAMLEHEALAHIKHIKEASNE